MKTIATIIFLLFISMVYSFEAHSQNNTIDSLKKILQNNKQDTEKVNVLNALCREIYRTGDFDKGKEYAENAFLLSQKIKFRKGEAEAYNNIGIIYYRQGDFPEALKNHTSSLKISNEIGNKKAVAASYNNIGMVYDDQGNFPEAFKNYFESSKISREIGDKKGIATTLRSIGVTYAKQGNNIEALKNMSDALKIYEETGDKTGIAISYSNMGIVYSSMGNHPEALKYHFAALKLEEKKGDKYGIATCYTNIGTIYFDQGDFNEALKNHSASLKIIKELGDKVGMANSYSNIGIIYGEQGNYPEALKNFSTALYIRTEIGDKRGIANSYNNIGLLYSRDGNYPDALKNQLASLKISEEIGDKDLIVSCYISLGAINVIQKNYSEAKRQLEKALSLSIEIGGVDHIKNTYSSLADLDSATGNWKDAYLHHKLYIMYRDSLINEENTKKIIRAQMQYEVDKKESLVKAEQEKKDAVAQREKNIQYFAIASLGILVLAVVTIAFIQWRNNKQKQAANNLLAQQKKKLESTLSELQLTQAQLIQSEKMASLGELTAGIAHEIQNPLNFVNNFSEVSNELLDEMKTELLNNNKEEAIAIADEVKQNLEKIDHHGKRADAIVKGMLQHSRVSTGQKELTNINALAEEYLRLSYHGIRAKDNTFNAQIKKDFDSSIGKINIIPQDIGRVLLNLYNNAFYALAEKKKHEDYNPTVSVTTKKQNDKVLISVEDNGVGVPPKVLDKIFQPFFTTKPTGQGTGLGLSLTYDIIKAHKGEIKVESKENEGAEFKITLPIN